MSRTSWLLACSWLWLWPLPPLRAAAPPTPGADTAPPSPASPAQTAPAHRLPGLSDLESIALDLPLYRVPESVYRVDAGDLSELHTPELSEALAQRVPGVVRNPVQGNPFQEDLIYRGFQVTPLLGAPIGLSAYLDGARINEGFGDTLNWDLVPEGALETAEVVSGPDALFGRNSLGGSLFLRTKTGFSFDGWSLEAQTGTEDRYALEAEHGGSRGTLAWYLHADWLDEDGWRRRTRSELRRVFGKLSYEGERREVHLSYRGALNDLTGNGLVPERVLDLNRGEVYTFPDDTRNTAHHLSLRGRHQLGDATWLRSLLFVRDYDRWTRNGDVELECDGEAEGLGDLLPARCRDAGGELLPEGEERSTETASLSWGARVALRGKRAWFGIDHAWVFGMSYESNRTRFEQLEADAELFAEGRAFGTRREDPLELLTAVRTRQHAVGIFGRDAVALTPTLSATLGARFDYVKIRLRDRTGFAENDDLNGSHGFHRFTGGAGLTYAPSPDLVFFASYREGWRAPTPAELSCADPGAPCNLPVAFVADPPLDEVVVGTAELGVRGELTRLSIRWSTAFYHSLTRDELLFVQSEVGGGGFFRNVERTRRMGFELQAVGARGPVRWSLNYAWTDARYESFATLASPVAAAGVRVEPGHRLPAVPAHALTGSFNIDLAPWWELGFDGHYTAGQFLRGDDANRLAKTPSYATLDLRSQWTLPGGFALWVRVTNLLDSEHEIGGARNFNAFAQPTVREERFLAPGAPRRFWVGLRWESR